MTERRLLLLRGLCPAVRAERVRPGAATRGQRKGGSRCPVRGRVFVAPIVEPGCRRERLLPDGGGEGGGLQVFVYSGCPRGIKQPLGQHDDG
jgi:hypothetical protein